MLLTPKPATLKKYGLSELEWQVMADNQHHACAICLQVPKKGRLVIDHFHVKGWKKMPPQERKRYVRCLACWTCNHYYLGRGITVERASNVVAVLEAFNRRLALPANDNASNDVPGPLGAMSQPLQWAGHWCLGQDSGCGVCQKAKGKIPAINEMGLLYWRDYGKSE